MQRARARERTSGTLERGYEIGRVLRNIAWGTEISDILSQNPLALLQPAQLTFDEPEQAVFRRVHNSRS